MWWQQHQLYLFNRLSSNLPSSSFHDHMDGPGCLTVILVGSIATLPSTSFTVPTAHPCVWPSPKLSSIGSFLHSTVTLILKPYNYMFNTHNKRGPTISYGMFPSETFIKSSRRDDLNIQSNFTSSFRSRSSKLPLEQNSVTMANTPQSWKKPRKGLTFSWRMSFICKHIWLFYYCLHYVHI